MNDNMKSICVIGLWHLGLINCVGFADLGIRVIGLDFNKKIISDLQKGKPPIYEPGLEERIIKHTRLKRLHFSSKAIDVSLVEYVIIAIKKIAPYLKSHTPVIITSQIPLGTSEKAEVLIRKLNKSWESGVVYIPENLKLGVAIERFIHPDMLVFGGKNAVVLRKVLDLYQSIDTKKFVMDKSSAEMVKHALNTYLATSIAFGNEIAHLCEKLGADAFLVGKALKADKRIGQAPILPGLGFSGGTLARDVKQLLKFSRQYRYKAQLLKSIFSINESTFEQIILKTIRRIGNLKGKTIGFLGLTYKPGTSTLRRSSAIKLINLFINKGAQCLAYDPKVDKNEFRSYSKIIKKVANVYELAKKSDILLLVTEWPEFKNLNYNSLAKNMKKPIIIDTKNFLDSEIIKKSGFIYEGYGRR